MDKIGSKAKDKEDTKNMGKEGLASGEAGFLEALDAAKYVSGVIAEALKTSTDTTIELIEGQGPGELSGQTHGSSNHCESFIQ